MANKYNLISALYQETSQAVTESPEAWMAFLRSTCRNYGLRFDEQLLVYAQRPEATAVLEIEKWNRTFGRWVNRGATGIAVFADRDKGKQQLKYYFDIADTHESRFARPVPLWSMEPEMEVPVIDTLEAAFGELPQRDTLSNAIASAAAIAVDDSIADYQMMLAQLHPGSGLEELGDYDRALLLHHLTEQSVSFLIMTRLGVTPPEQDAFVEITRFNTPEVLNCLGFAASDIAKAALTEVSRTVNRILAEQQKNHYNEIKQDERSTEHGNHLPNAGGLPAAQPDPAESALAGAGTLRTASPELPAGTPESGVLQPADLLPSGAAPGRDSDPSIPDGGTAPAADGQNRGRDGEAESHGHDDLGTADEQHPKQSTGDRPDGSDLRLEALDWGAVDRELPFFGTTGVIHEILRTTPHLTHNLEEVEQFLLSEPTPRQRAVYAQELLGTETVTLTLQNDTVAGYRPYANGLYVFQGLYESRTGHTFLSWESVADHLEGLRLLGELTSVFNPLPTVNTQLSMLEFAGARTPAFSFSQELIDLVLTGGSRYSQGKLRIYRQMTLDQPTEENICFLKHEYGTGGSYPVLSGIDLDEAHDSKGILLRRGFRQENSQLLKWPYVERRIRELIRENRYLSPVEQEQYPQWLAELSQNELETDPDLSDEITEPDTVPTSEHDMPEQEPEAIPTPEPESVEALQEPEKAPMERRDYRISDDAIGVGKPLERFTRNLAAIGLLKELEDSGALATPEQQEILAQYVGWGGLAEFFEESNPHYGELRALLTEAEYASARESTLTAFYTPPVVIRAVYQALENMGLRQGNLLEPSCGIGNFIGMLPEAMAGSRVYGVELDSISGRIAQQLYQNQNITIDGFENTSLPDSFFDAAVGNVPFGDFKANDSRYNRQNWLIHDYFFGKTLDKVRPGGVIAFITSKGTMDKANPAVRKYLAQRAELLGAIRLPNDTFKAAAGTEVTGDILFLQKRERLVDAEPDWVHLGQNADGIAMNQYFLDHPEMILGDMVLESGRFGQEAVCKPIPGGDLQAQLTAAISHIHGSIGAVTLAEELPEAEIIPADPTVRNFSHAVMGGKLYYRENSLMHPVTGSAAQQQRIRGMIAIRDCVRTLLEQQTEGASDEAIRETQEKLNTLYDSFAAQHGLLNSRPNLNAFREDASASLLAALEIMGEGGKLERKADIFTRRTIRPHVPVTSVDTASEALAVSMGERGRVDIPYMMQLTGKTEEELYTELHGVIFRNPLKDEAEYLPADEYLSGNVREKLAVARKAAEQNPDFAVNVQMLEQVQPKDLTASEISVRLGATWLPPEIVRQFMFYLLEPPLYARWKMRVNFSAHTGEWQVENKSADPSNLKAVSTYGTPRINAYKIIEDTLNLRDVRIYDYVEDMDGKRKAVLNRKETAIAQAKQEAIKQAFSDWVWQDHSRRELLCGIYNARFNAIRPREYDGSHIVFAGMNPEITLRPHQTGAIAHILYGGNTLLAHAVGGGKTYEMTAAAMESKRLGLCTKPLFVVPNHLVGQWASEFLQLYPAANILAVTKKDFETQNRKRICGRIATGDYDAVIIGHSQLEKIPMSLERQRQTIQQEIDQVLDGISELKRQHGDRFSIKQMERSRKQLEAKLAKLNDQSRKDDVVTFEELGVDMLFVDEAHYFKNLAAFTKMRNVAGISQTEAQKSSDLYMKCRYLDELTGGRGVVFATGTPISNSMVEMYTMQKYLQHNTLQRNGLLSFDAWASTFGETVTAVELTPEGTGYRTKTRFARFYNLPELMTMFKEAADIQTADMLKLPVPEAEFHNVSVKPSEYQRDMVAQLSERAEKVRSGEVRSDIDNMLLITNDGRKLALDQRMVNPLLPDFEGSKINACVKNVFRLWEETTPDRCAQLVFCDLSTPKSDGFSVYNDIRDKLVNLGIPREEIQFIHDADTEAKKQELFRKVRSGEVRVLLGSTQKMGAGTNVQDRLIALHDLDCPWRPADLEQRLGRIVRQGNRNPKVEIFRYVTEQTFDAYLYQLVEGKQKFASQIMSSKSPVRTAEDIDETALSYAEIKMLATGDPHVKEKMDLDIQVQKLRLLKANFLSEHYALEDKILKWFPQEIRIKQELIGGLEEDAETVKEHPRTLGDSFGGITVLGKDYSSRSEGGQAILDACQGLRPEDTIALGSFRGFGLELHYDRIAHQFVVELKGALCHRVPMGADPAGNITRLDNRLDSMDELLTTAKAQLSHLEHQLETAKEDVQKPFPQEAELAEKTERLNVLNALLNVDHKENELADTDPEPTDPPQRSRKGQER